MKSSASVALVLSAAAHAALVLALWWNAGPSPKIPCCIDTRVEEGVHLSVSWDEKPPAPAPRPLPPGPDFDAQVVEMPVDLLAPAVEQVAHLAGPGALTEVAAPRGPGDPAGVGVTTRPARAPLFPAVTTPCRIVFVLDRSVSMGPSGALETACSELARSLEALPPGSSFQVVPYNQHAEPLRLLGHTDLVPATPASIEEAVRQLQELRPGGGTDHVRALRRGLALWPDVLYFVTDADDLSPADVQAVARANAHRARVHVIELNPTGQERPGGLLRALAQGNGGTYRLVAPR